MQREQSTCLHFPFCSLRGLERCGLRLQVPSISGGGWHCCQASCKSSVTIAEYPAAMVRLACSKCDRVGQYRKATLITRYGRATRLPHLLRDICANCPKMDVLGNDPCGVRYRDL